MPITALSCATVVYAVGPATQLAMSVQPAGAVAGVALTTQPQVQLKDANGNNVTTAGVAVTASKHSGVAGTLSGTTTVNTNSSGIAVFTNLAMSAAENGVTLDFASTGLTSVTSGAFSVSSGGGSATQLAMSTQPAGAVAGVALTTQPQVQLKDANGNNVTTAGVAVTASKHSGVAGTLSGTITVNTNSSGIAVFTNLAMSAAENGVTLDFASTGLTGVTSNPFSVSSADNPAPSGTTVLDTRAGGPASIQAGGVTTLAAADAAITGTGLSIYRDFAAFTTDFDGSGTHAYRAEIPAWDGTPRDGGSGILRIIIPNPKPTELYVQWKQWMGRTASGGGIGSLGAFDIVNEGDPGPSGRKVMLMCRPRASDPGGCGPRADYVWGGQGTNPAYARGEGWYGVVGNPGQVHFNVSAWAPEDHYNEVITQTVYLKASSADDVADGVYKVWVNGVLRASWTGIKIGAEAVDRFDYGSTFRSPHFNMTEYWWDFVCWVP